MYADLSAFGATGPATPEDVLSSLLRSLGVPGSAIPLDTAERAALFRSVTAGRAVALLLDDAASFAQVRVLLPASVNGVVVVTSRWRLGGLALVEATTVCVDPLDTDSAVRLLAEAVGPDRVAAEPAPAHEVASLCAGMPIALRIAAARLATRPHWRLVRLVGELADARRRLGALVLEDGDGPSVSVRAGFDLSYRALPVDAARTYRLLSLHPGTEFSGAAVAAAIGTPRRRVEELLDVLVRASLLVDLADERYRFHDLLRIHAHRLVEAHDPERVRLAAVRSMVLWYLDQAVAADAVVTPLRQHLGARYRRHLPPAVPAPRDAEPDRTAEALDQLERELPNLLVAQETAARHGWDEVVWQLGEALWGLFLYRGHYSEWITVCERGAHAAARCGDRVAESRMLVQLAAAYLRHGRPDRALPWCLRSWDRAQAVGDWRSQATALENLGAVAHAQGRLADAVAYYRRSLSINERHRRTRGVALLRCYLGYALAELGDPDSAVDSFRGAVAAAASIGDHNCQAQAHVGIGTVHAQQGRLQVAIAELTEGLAVLSATAAPALRVSVLERLGEISRQAGDHAGARGYWEQALDLYTRMGNPKADRVRTLLCELTGAAMPPDHDSSPPVL
jgi:tetratricopeptide (TPR) repeat protein